MGQLLLIAPQKSLGTEDGDSVSLRVTGSLWSPEPSPSALLPEIVEGKDGWMGAGLREPHTAPHPGGQGWSLGPANIPRGLLSPSVLRDQTPLMRGTAMFRTLGVLQAQKQFNQQPVVYKTDSLFFPSLICILKVTVIHSPD